MQPKDFVDNNFIKQINPSIKGFSDEELKDLFTISSVAMTLSKSIKSGLFINTIIQSCYNEIFNRYADNKEILYSFFTEALNKIDDINNGSLEITKNKNDVCEYINYERKKNVKS